MRVRPSVGLRVSPRRGSCGCTGLERLLARSLGGRLARLELESRVASGGGDEGGGWEPPEPIADPRTPPQRSPPRTSRLGGGVPHPSSRCRLWDYKSRQSLLQDRGPRGDRGHGPRTSTAPALLAPFSAFLSGPMVTSDTSQSPGAKARSCTGPLGGYGAAPEDTPPPLPLLDPTRGAETMRRRLFEAAGPHLRHRVSALLGLTPAGLQAGESEGGRSVQENCSHRPPERPLWVASVRICRT